MHTKHVFSGLIVPLTCLLLGACDPPGSDPPTPIGVTPADTSAPTLVVNIEIKEDQDAADRMSVITLRFSTDVVDDDNYVIFDDGESVTCNGLLVELNNMQEYKFKVPQERNYTCSYIGNKNGSQLPPVPMIDIPARSLLSPQKPAISGQGYTVNYTPDSSDQACSITADAVDSSNSDISGPRSSSDVGVYTGPATSSLSGSGEIILKRTCTWTLHGPFDTISLTYLSIASVEVTWSH